MTMTKFEQVSAMFMQAMITSESYRFGRTFEKMASEAALAATALEAEWAECAEYEGMFSEDAEADEQDA